MKFGTIKLVVAMVIAAVFGFSDIATAGDNIVVGTLPASGSPGGQWDSGDVSTGGELITVNEDDPCTVVNYWSYVDTWSLNMGGVRALSKGYIDPNYGPTVYVGLGWGYPDVKSPTNNAFPSPSTTSFASYWNYPYEDGVDAIGMKPNGDVLVGIGGGQTWGAGEILMYALNKTNLTTGASDFTGETSNTSLRGATGYGLDITEVESISNGTIVVAVHNQVYLADGYDLYTGSTGGLVQSAEYSGVWYHYFDSHVTAMAVTPNGHVVTGLSSGYIDVRAMSDFGTVLADVNLASQINELEILPNGNIVAGLNNGYVKVLNGSTLATISSANFGDPIGGLAATKNGNVAIGVGNLLYVRRGNNLALNSDLSAGSAGIDMGNPIGALTAVSPIPTE
jgi:hypothetical protein